ARSRAFELKKKHSLVIPLPADVPPTTLPIRYRKKSKNYNPFSLAEKHNFTLTADCQQGISRSCAYKLNYKLHSYGAVSKAKKYVPGVVTDSSISSSA
uniref:Uncharacterized protein n=1 Tax=Triticum urartu TaxID=4572 RepID=A0A8R7PCF8_TRIUA